MATKKKSDNRKQKSDIVKAEMPEVVETKAPNKMVQKANWVTNLGWGLLLVGGLAHMLPGQMEPLLKISQFGISVQMLVGVLSVLVALNFLLGDE